MNMQQGMERHSYSTRKHIITIYCPQYWGRIKYQVKLQFSDIFHYDNEWTGLEVPIGNDTCIDDS